MKLLFSSLLCLLGTGGLAFAQQTSPPSSPAQPSSAEQARVFITDSNSWEVRSGGAAGAGPGGFGAISSSSGGARPQTAEVIKTFGQRCPQVIVNNRANMADYIVELDDEGGKGLLTHKDKIAVFVRTSGDGIFSKSTLSVGGSVQDACGAILAHWVGHSAELKTAALAAATPPPAAAPVPIIVQAQAAASPGISVDASVPNCGIEVDGDFVGNTPSTVTLAPGKHQIVVKKAGYQDWTRGMTVSGGNVHQWQDGLTVQNVIAQL